MSNGVIPTYCGTYLNNKKTDMQNGLVVAKDGTKLWYKDDKLHREDGPAIEWLAGDMDWCLDGKSLGRNARGFWNLWDLLTPQQRGNPTLLRYLPR
jgi:hypothetical protein